MSEKNYLLISAAVFGAIALLHGVRLLARWSVQIGATAFPLWGSAIAIVVAAAMSFWALRLMSQWQQSHL